MDHFIGKPFQYEDLAVVLSKSNHAPNNIVTPGTPNIAIPTPTYSISKKLDKSLSTDPFNTVTTYPSNVVARIPTQPSDIVTPNPSHRNLIGPGFDSLKHGTSAFIHNVGGGGMKDRVRYN